MTCHKTNLDIRLDKLNGIKIKDIVPEECNIPYSLIIPKGKEKEAKTLLEKLIKELGESS
jgi:hypothetical protein